MIDEKARAVSDSAELKAELERTKLELEIEKTRADKTKIELETDEMRKPFFRKQAFLQAALLAFITVLVTGLGVGWTIYNGFNELEIGRQQADKDSLQKDHENLLERNELAESQRNSLADQIADQKKEREALLSEKRSLESESVELRKERAKIGNELQLLMAKSIVQQGLQQSRINDLQLKMEQADERIREADRRTAKAERNVLTSDIKGSYLQLRAVTKLPDSLPDGESIKRVQVKTIESTYEEIAGKFKSGGKPYQEVFTDFLATKITADSDKSSAFMFGYLVTRESQWKDQLIAFAREHRFLAEQPGGYFYDSELFSNLLAALYDDESNRNELYGLILDSLESFDVRVRNGYLYYFGPLFAPMATDVPVGDKAVFLRLIRISRDDFLVNGPGLGSELLFRRSYRAYFSVAAKVLSESDDLCDILFVNVIREYGRQCDNDAVRIRIISRGGVVGVGGPTMGTPVTADRESWRRWLDANRERVTIWLEEDLSSLYRDDALFQRVTTDKTTPYFILN